MGLYTYDKEALMSFYLGKDNAGNSTLHTTNAALGEAAMRSGVNVNTTFHSSLPYLQLVKRIVVPHYTVGHFNGQFTTYRFYVMLPDEVIALVNSGYLFTVVVSTQNSSGQRVGVPLESGFSAQKGVSPSYVNSLPVLIWYPSLDLGASGSTTASTTYKYLRIERTEPGLLYQGGYSVGPDVIYTAEMIFYNVLNTNIDIKNSVNEVILSPSEFSIKTPTSTLNMANFSPVKVSSSITTTSFKPAGSSIYIEPIGSSLKPVKGWILDSSDSSNCIIQKVLSDNTVETVVSNSTKNLIYIGTTEYTYGVSARGSLGSSPGLFTLAQDEMAIVSIKGTFYNSVTDTITVDGSVPFIGNANGSYSLVKGTTVRVSNGSYYCDSYTFYLSMVNGVAYLKNNATKWCSNSPIEGVFSGTMKVLKFNIR